MSDINTIRPISNNRIYLVIINKHQGDASKVEKEIKNLQAVFPGRSKWLTRILNNTSQPNIEELGVFSRYLEQSIDSLVVFQNTKTASAV